MSWQARAQALAREGLYDPATEHASCGVGMVVAVGGERSRAIIDKALEGLCHLWHRGAVAADGQTGDGAGIHLALPHAFFAEYLTENNLGHDEKPAVGMVFLPAGEEAAQAQCRAIIAGEAARLGYGLHGWRVVPVVADAIGDVANASRPAIEQVLLAVPRGHDDARVERDLYLMRRRIEQALRAAGRADCYVCSLSHASIIYKGMLKAEQLAMFYPDLMDARFTSNFAIFHQRFSTNTAPAWALAQPFRVLAHNGEINTLRGNVNLMKSHEATFRCDAYAGLEADLLPVIDADSSDTGALDAVMEILCRAGRSLPLAKLMLVPPAWRHRSDTPQHHRDLFACCNSVSEPWDGPAALAMTDGEWVVAGMDRNGLRPMRYTLTRGGMLICASESGMVAVDEAEVVERGRLGPGEMIGVHLPSRRFFRDGALKDHLAATRDYAAWAQKSTRLGDVLAAHAAPPPPLEDAAALWQRQRASGLSFEHIEQVLHPMAATAKEAVGSMGDDTAIAGLAPHAPGFHHFFRQNFSQVTNPPIDPLRERGVMSLLTRLGNGGNFLAIDDSHAAIVLADTPVLLADEFDGMLQHFAPQLKRLDAVFSPTPQGGGLRAGLDRLVREAEAAVRGGAPYLLLSDEARSATQVAMPMVLAIAAVQSHLVARKLRKRASLLVRSDECCDVHALAVMIGAGATVVHPALAEATVRARHAAGLLPGMGEAQARENLREAFNLGLLKVMSKMGISVVRSYRGGMNFEAIGLDRALVDAFFPGVPSRLSGMGLGGIEARALALHHAAYAPPANDAPMLPVGGFYRWRAGAEAHGWPGENIHALQQAVTQGSYALYKKYSASVQQLPPLHLRDLLAFRPAGAAIALEAVEPADAIVRRFVAPAMSLGALSPEAHEVLAIAMNRLGAASNSGEGGEGPERYRPRANGDDANSVVKQVASGRFGVTAEYLNSARELQIKVAQGAKPGEGGQLPGFKVTVEIARLRHATPGTTLISPPPHHDIYSIEDLAQLTYDLKQVNPTALVSVKLVAQAGIGTIASGVVKAMADKIVIAGHSGGTGASPLSSIKHAGVPWELGLAEANQVLSLNRLRHRVVLQTDGGLKTGRDIVIAALLGAEEYAIGTAALVAMGCLMVRQCHSNTCPVGITTQDEMLRSKFSGTVEKVMQLMRFIAEEVREILAMLGAPSLEAIVGRADLLEQVARPDALVEGLDLRPLLLLADAGGHPRFGMMHGRNAVPDTLDASLLAPVQAALAAGAPITLEAEVHNTMRSIGTRLSSLVAQHGAPLADGQITLQLRGTAGQSLGAFLARGLRIALWGEANDYVGKGLSGGEIMVRPRADSTLLAHTQTIIGNTVLYGATAGRLFASGQAGERFAVRNSGAQAVVEGCGANGCEYMTGGVVVILGEVGDNFAAGMTGGTAFVYDPLAHLAARLNGETVTATPCIADDDAMLQPLLAQHVQQTGSALAQQMLADWAQHGPHFRVVRPKPV
jgi:glutamate synthase (NADPH/NADH) large chain